MCAEPMQTHGLLSNSEHRKKRTHDAGKPACFDRPWLRLAIAEYFRPVAGRCQATGKKSALQHMSRHAEEMQ